MTHAPLPSWDDDELSAILRAVEHLSEQECREFIGSLYRAVLAHERSGDTDALTQFAREARTTARLWADPNFRRAVGRLAGPVAPDATLSVSEVLAKLDG